jgi:trehalose/maltose hydrolase-like predicted phosphorylase
MMRDCRLQRMARNLVTAAGAVLLIAGSVAVASSSAVASPVASEAVHASTPSNPWVLSNTSYSPTDYTQEPFVGNGYLSQRLPAIGSGYEGGGLLGEGDWPLYNDRYTTALVAGVYETSGGSDYIASLPTWSGLSLTVGGDVLDASVPSSAISGYSQTLDMKNAIVTTSLTWTPKPGEATAVTYQVLANRQQMHLGQVQVEITPSWSGTLSLTGLLDGSGAQRITPVSRSVDLATNTATVQLTTPGRSTAVAETERLVPGQGVNVTTSSPVSPADDAATAGVQWTIPVTAGRHYTITKYVGISTSNDPGDPAAVAAATVNRATAVGWDALVAGHDAAWKDLWAPNIAVADASAQAAVNSSFYLLYSSLRAGVNFSIPPAGLSSDNYGGEIFWDADTWMFPALLAFHPELAKSIVMFRYDTKAAAEANAAAAGYQGGSWAWDNGPSGTCGGLAPCSHYEDHLQSDIALAQWQYYEATGDVAWLRSYGYPVMKDVAEFWASRVQLGTDGKYHINDVTGPDEYTSGVNDESATNAGAVSALRDAVAAARVLGVAPAPSWSTIADNMYIDVDPDGTHPEYPGYTNETVKQADTVLMTYPFGYVTSNAVAAADLNRYLPVTDPGGPAMTASVEAVIAGQVQTPGCLDYTLFQNAYQPFVRGAFDQFNETQYLTPSAGQTNPAFDFATGAGGFLQTFAYGFAGLRWDPAVLRLDPTLPPQLSGGITITGLRYQGRTLTVRIGPKTTSVQLTSGRPVTLSTPAGTQTLAHGAVTVATARPDLDPTDNLARCQNATASSSQVVDQPAAAVDGDTATSWIAANTASSYAVTLGAPASTDRADITWGSTLPANYVAQVQLDNRTWRTVAAGPVAGTGNLDVSWPAVKTRAVRFDFSGGQPASIAELTVPDPAAAYVTSTLSAPQVMPPGIASTVTLTERSAGGATASNVTSNLALPAGWTASADPAPATIPAGSSATATWSVTPPPGAATSATLTATTSWQTATQTDSTQASASTFSITPAALGTTVQAEDGVLAGGASTASNHNGYTGTGFVQNLYPGASDTVAYQIPAAGSYPVTIRYANSLGGQSPPYQNVTRTVSVAAGGQTQQVSLPVTGSWDTWSTATVNLNLPSGDDLVQMLVTANDSGSVNVDSITVGTP